MSSVVMGPFGDCKNAILQHIDNVQAAGALVAIHLDSDLIEYCSANSAEFLGIEPTQLLGRKGREWLSTQRSALCAIASPECKLGWRNFAGADPLVVIGHRQGAHMIFEFERATTASQPHWWDHAVRTRFAEQLTAGHTAEDCREFLVRWIFELSGYDRRHDVPLPRRLAWRSSG